MLQKIWQYAGGVVTLLLGWLYFEHKGRQKAEAKLENAELNRKDAVLENEQQRIEREIEEEKRKMDGLEREHSGNLSSDEVERYWNGKKDS